MNERPDLDGARVQEPGSHNVWLVFHGRRHRIESSEVYDSLFREVDNIVKYDDVSEIIMGPELNNGTCLVRAPDTLPIYLLTGFPTPYRHFIPTYETLLEFNFDLEKVIEVPALILETVALGEDLEAAGDRRQRER